MNPGDNSSSGVVRLEALADGLARYSGYGTPDHEAYRSRNPGLVRAADGTLRKFRSLADGYRAFLHDLERYCRGSRLRPNPTVLDLCRATGRGDFVAAKAVSWARRALNAPVTVDTPLRWFVSKA